MDTIKLIWFWLLFYSFVGWCYESSLWTLKERHFVNRGFLKGPYCPIYGLGALLLLAFLGRFHNPFTLFFGGMLITCSLEYAASYFLEEIFHRRWWDYSVLKYHLNGRISLLGAVAFGLFSVLLISFIHPAVSTGMTTDSFKFEFLLIFATLGFLFDLGYSVAKYMDLKDKVKEIKQLWFRW